MNIGVKEFWERFAWNNENWFSDTKHEQVRNLEDFITINHLSLHTNCKLSILSCRHDLGPEFYNQNQVLI